MHTRPFTHGRTLICITNKMGRKTRQSVAVAKKVFQLAAKECAKYVKLEKLNGNEKYEIGPEIAASCRNVLKLIQTHKILTINRLCLPLCLCRLLFLPGWRGGTPTYFSYIPNEYTRVVSSTICLVVNF